MEHLLLILIEILKEIITQRIVKAPPDIACIGQHFTQSFLKFWQQTFFFKQFQCLVINAFQTAVERFVDIAKLIGKVNPGFHVDQHQIRKMLWWRPQFPEIGNGLLTFSQIIIPSPYREKSFDDPLFILFKQSLFIRVGKMVEAYKAATALFQNTRILPVSTFSRA